MTRRTKDLVASIVSTLSDSTSSGVEKETLILQKRVALSRAITLIESQSPTHMQQADLLLNHVVKLRGEKSTHVSGNGDESDIMEQKGKAFRVGIAGAPGSGKSSLIESLGTHILDNCYQGDDGKCSFTPEKIAVVCIDPSSSITGGSILGDKTRMMELSRHPRAFVRPSPSKGVLGGLSSYTNDVVSLCEAAGYELVLVETVGLGQSEVDVSQAVDMLVLIVSPGGGDGLQGAKKGILEVADSKFILSFSKFCASDSTYPSTTSCTYRSNKKSVGCEQGRWSIIICCKSNSSRLQRSNAFLQIENGRVGDTSGSVSKCRD